MSRPLLLASASAARRAMLEAAGIALQTVPARIDEAALKGALAAEGARPRDIADALAEAKALKISRRHPEALILGADQVLAAGDALFDKPADLAAARAQLLALRGRAHELLSAAVIAEGGEPVWRHVGRARLTMRDFSDAFLDDYLAREGGHVLASVGAYRIEGAGVQLFSRIEGDHFCILGLPLLEILAYLRLRGVCPA
ncbi:MAG TPA: Maf family protein [Paracoccaceae bacterium]|nr:Maf family protein [Paracoccaceae bacterium]